MLTRLSFGVIGRLPRLTPEPGAVFNEYAVPAGVCPSRQFFSQANLFSGLHHLRLTLLTIYTDHSWNELVDDAPERKYISFT